jgi:hypothetical protein
MRRIARALHQDTRKTTPLRSCCRWTRSHRPAPGLTAHGLPTPRAARPYPCRCVEEKQIPLLPSPSRSPLLDAHLALLPSSLLLGPMWSTSTTACSSSELSLTMSHRAEDHPKSPVAKSQTPAAPSAAEASPAAAALGHDLPQLPPPCSPPVLGSHSRTVSCPP